MSARPEMSAVIAHPASSALRAFLTRVERRVSWIAAAEGAAAGFAIAALVAIGIGWTRGSLAPAVVAGTLLIAAGLGIGLMLSARRRRSVAKLVERRAPHCRNVVITAAELIGAPTTVRPEIGSLVVREATRSVSALDPASLFPARRAITALGAGAVFWAIALIFAGARPALPAIPTDVPTESVGIAGIGVVIVPPAYAARASQSLRDPARIDALAGSRIRLTVEATAAAVNVETIDGRQALAADGSRSFSGDIVAGADGYLSIEPVSSGGRSGARRLIGLSVTPDRAPRVRVTAPGRDLFLSDAWRTLDLAVEADDDIGLASLRLRYTKVSGSGERFTFTDGESPLAITRTDGRTWTARGTLALGALTLEAGDVIVYRAVAADRRPGAVPTESDAFIVEITSPGAIASEGFAVDDEFDRNAVSQQMVILKTERLLERRSAMTAEAFAEQALGLAAEQRRVRAEFVFMMGGELAQEVTGDSAGITELNEEEEAESSDDILAGRLANRGRLELMRAIRSMSDAASGLVATRVDSALADERLALDHLQRAFSRTRYILRALTQRERLDLSRRLTGVLTDAGRDTRPVAEAIVDPRMAALRGALASIAALAGTERFDDGAGARASVIAQSVLRVGLSSEPLRDVAARLADAADEIGRGRSVEARAMLDRAAVALAFVVRAELVNAPPRSLPGGVSRLEGALTAALRRPGGSR